jgi:hypothetical protein
VKRTYWFRRGEREGCNGPDRYDSILARRGQQKANEYRAGWKIKEANIYELVSAMNDFLDQQKEPAASPTPGSN